MSVHKLTGLAQISHATKGVDAGEEIAVRLSFAERAILVRCSTTLPLKLNPKAARHLADCLVAAALEIESLAAPAPTATFSGGSGGGGGLGFGQRMKAEKEET